MLKLAACALGAVIILAAVLILVARQIWHLPQVREASTGHYIAATTTTRLGATWLPLAKAHPGLTGVAAVPGGPEAFVARVAMIRAADHSIDARYYIWQDDLTGMMLLEELRLAAERGVQVRLLLDDNGIPGLDSIFAALDAMPTVEVRLFNPFVLRSPRLLNYAFDFPRLNRRMHNKSLSVDGLVTLIGGRNIGDIYFSFGEVHYRDLDVVAVGEGASAVNADFDRYWNSESAWPAGQILTPAPDGLAELADRLARYAQRPEGAAYIEILENSPLVKDLTTGTLALEWTSAQLVSDHPRKGLARETDDHLMISQLNKIIGRPETSIALISAYFVPGEAGSKLLTDAAESGVKVTVLTNSQEATDVALVQSGYIRHRKDLVTAGVTVWELAQIGDEPPPDTRFGFIGSATSSLHAKAFAIDGQRAFIGSFNFDPRSARLNCEMGFVIDSPTIARLIEASVSAKALGGIAYNVTLAPDDRLSWTGPGATIYDHDPETTWLGRLTVSLASYLPIAWML